MSDQGDGEVRESTGEDPVWTGLWLREARLRRGLGVKELSERAGVSTGAIQDIEADRIASPGLIVMLKLARGMDMPLGAVLGEKGGGDQYQLGYQTAVIDMQDALYKLRQAAKG